MVAEFLRAWITFSLMILGAAAGVAFWAARAGHFRHQDRARHLALWAEVEKEEESETFTAKARRTQRKSEEENS